MTPEVIRYGEVTNYIYELSTGRGFLSDSPIYGVTLLTKQGDKVNHQLNKCFQDKQEALEYISSLNDQSAIFA